MAPDVSNYYDGCRSLLWVSELTGISVDQINFLISQLAAVALASLFRTVLHSSKVSSAARHGFGLIIGIIIGYFCFGIQAVHLAGLPAICYIIIRTQSPEVMQRWVLFVSLTYLSCIHLRRQIYDYGSYSLDITGPLMVITQKVTSLAFNLHDGLTKTESEMTNMQLQYAVKKLPTPLEFFSYTLLFPTLMVGPLIYYKDYIDFIDGRNLMLANMVKKDNPPNPNTVIIEPSPTIVVYKKVVMSIICALIFVKLLPLFPIKRIKEDEFLESTSLIQKFLFLITATTLVRFKYYFAWTLSDAICNNAGLGFNGYSKDGSPKWDKFSNVDIVKFECSTNLRESIEAWNMGTNSWLRIIVYERMKKYKTILTYALSALWHGFYPGYYLTFANGALFTFAARSVRRSIRSYFVNSEHKMLYDVVTFLATRLVMAYITYTFVLLEFWPSIRLYKNMYWCLHIMAFIALILPKLIPNLLPREVRNTSSKGAIAEALSQASSFHTEVSRHHD